ncbi:hypothetical protein ACM55K_06065 [Flavobacterium sp. LT1R49]|uniref:hypothetical protein n=1 Tax=Flavobacterium arabinosi TaxID=3398737 RepID=UPI003A8885E7
MNSINKSIFVFGLYSLSMGMVLLFLAILVLPMVGLPISKEPWLHLLGFVLISSSFYYLRSALKGNIDFARYILHTRLFAPLVVIFLIGTGKAD